jgi:hypothetical protein
MFLQFGQIATISIAAAILTGSSDPGGTQAWVYVAIAALLAVSLFIIPRVPEHRGSW